MAIIPAGFDLFETIAGETSFVFPNNFPIPANFFDNGSHPFIGTIHLEGLPIRNFTGPNGVTHPAGTTDTVIHRQQDVHINQFPGSGTTTIQMVQLSMRSHSPVAVHVGHSVQHWDVFVTVSSLRPSGGTMTISMNAATDRGGVFDSTLKPVPFFRFVRRSDGMEKHLDAGTLPIPPHIAANMTLYSSMVEWHMDPPGGDQTDGGPFPPLDLTQEFYVGCPLPAFELAALARHGVKCPKRK